MTTQDPRIVRPQANPLPKFWRPAMPASVKLDAKLTHWDLVNRISAGGATTEDLWDWIETGFTYSKMMQLLAEDGSEFTPEAEAAIAEQIASYEGVIARYRKTGRVGFSGPELLVARAAACVMDGLIDMDRHGIAERAAYWSIEVLRRIRLNVYQGMKHD